MRPAQLLRANSNWIRCATVQQLPIQCPIGRDDLVVTNHAAFSYTCTRFRFSVTSDSLSHRTRAVLDFSKQLFFSLILLLLSFGKGFCSPPRCAGVPTWSSPGCEARE